MTKFKFCQACTFKKHGVKTRKSIPHTCELGDPNFKGPEIKTFSEGEYVKVFYNKLIYESKTSGKFHLKAKQWINGYKVNGQNNEVWIPDFMYLIGETNPVPYIWVKKSYYDKMAFV